MGQDAAFLSDRESGRDDFEKASQDRHNEQIKQDELLNRYTKGHYNPDRSSIDSLSFTSFQHESMRGNNSFRAPSSFQQQHGHKFVGHTEDLSLCQGAYLKRLNRNQKSMRIDSVYSGPFMSSKVNELNGGFQKDKRLRLNRSLENVNQ